VTMEWRCAGCGILAPNKASQCECPTYCVYDRETGKSAARCGMAGLSDDEWAETLDLMQRLVNASHAMSKALQDDEDAEDFDDIRERMHEAANDCQVKIHELK